MASCSPSSSLQVFLAALHTHLECKVCMESFTCLADEEPDRRPMSLCCGHVLCAECIRLLSAISVAADANVHQELLCPFCRLASRINRIAPCRPLVELQEELQQQQKQWNLDNWQEAAEVEAFIAPLAGVEYSQAPIRKTLSRGSLCFVRAFGGWGALVNPTSLALFRSRALAVVHDGKQRVVVFGCKGQRLHGFGRKGKARTGLTYPLGITILPSDHIVVTDGGEAALRVFTSRGGAVTDASDWLGLPWGVASCGEGSVLVTDEQHGALWRLEVDTARGRISSKSMLLEGLESPRAVACCKLTGHIALVEHLTGDRCTQTPGLKEDSKNTHAFGHILTETKQSQLSTRLRLFSSDLTPLALIDSFSLSSHTGSSVPPPCLTSVTFDSGGHLIAADARAGMVWSLGTPWVGTEEEGSQQGGISLTPLVRDGLVRPTCLQVSGETLFVLDSGDQAVKVYSSRPEM